MWGWKGFRCRVSFEKVHLIDYCDIQDFIIFSNNQMKTGDIYIDSLSPTLIEFSDIL